MIGSKNSIGWICLLSSILGLVVGFWIGREHFPRHWDRRQRYEKMLERFDSRLQLTPEQKPQVRSVFESKRQKMEALRGEMRPKFQEIRRSTQEDLRKLLTPDQQKKFERMEAEWQVRMKKRHPEWNSP